MDKENLWAHRFRIYRDQKDSKFGCLKRFKILSDKYRNRRKRFGLRLNLIAGIHSREGFDLSQIGPQKNKSLGALDFYIGETTFLGKNLGEEVLKLFLKTELFPFFETCLVDTIKSNKHALLSFAKARFSTVFETKDRVWMVASKEVKINPIVILGSSRSDGHTLKAIQTVMTDPSIPIVDLNLLSISEYDYHHGNVDDDFIPLAEKMLQHNPIILATPVYWYTMSAKLKIFIDRFSDFLDVRKDIGRRLAYKELFVIASYGESIPRAFEEPFLQFCEYLNMRYGGCLYHYSGKNRDQVHKNTSRSSNFSDLIFKNSSSQY